MKEKQETRITIRFPADLIEQLRQIAQEENRSLNSEVVYAVRDYLKRKKTIEA